MAFLFINWTRAHIVAEGGAVIPVDIASSDIAADSVDDGRIVCAAQSDL